MPRRGLIFDIGLHKGEDTAFYLRKGFRVVAVEANPKLVEHCRVRFARAISNGRLKIVDRAIADRPGPIPFYVNEVFSDWGTASEDWMLRNDRWGAASVKTEVEAVTMESLFASHGIPYYLKVDIEGFDDLCISPLVQMADKPEFVSVESHAWSQEETSRLLDLLAAAGYTKFNVVSQIGVASQTCPQPPLEGIYVDFRFRGHPTGLFGKELPGPWLDLKQAKSRFFHIYEQVAMFGPHTGVLRQTEDPAEVERLNQIYPDAQDWFDIHATS